MLPFPEPPDVPATQRATGTIHVRYEDISQDGRVLTGALAQALGAVVWRKLLADHPVMQQARPSGTFALLSRLVLEGGDGPVAVGRPLAGEGRFQLAHTVGPAGAVDGLLLNMWVTVTGARSRTHGPPPPRAGEPVQVGRVFGEHVFTRPFAPPDQRKVLRLDAPGLPPVPPARADRRAPEELLALPAGAEPLDGDELAPDPAPLAFGLAHTDSNQHVNSLVYPRLFEEAALRRLAERGRPTALLARQVEIAYRKPCFAGERMRIALRAFALGDRFGAVGGFFPDGAAPARAHCYLRMQLSRG